MVRRHLPRQTVIGSTKISSLQCGIWTEWDDSIIFCFFFLPPWKSDVTVHNRRSVQRSKKCFFFYWIMWGCVNPTWNLTNVLAGFTKGTHQLLHLHTNYCISLSRGRQPVNRDLPWGIWCTHRAQTSSLLLYRFHFLSPELLSAIRHPSARICCLSWEPGTPIMADDTICGVAVANSIGG